MSETIFAFNAVSGSSDHYLGICRVKEDVPQSILGSIIDAIRDATGEEYAYLESVDLYTDNPDFQKNIRFYTSEIMKDFQVAYELTP